MKTKILLFASVTLLSASCSLFGSSTPAGVIKTVNGGADWQFFNTITDPENSSLDGVNISRLAFDPQNREIVYAAAYNAGLFKSEDSADTWRRILTNIDVFDYAIHPQDSKVLYAAGAFDGQGKVLASRDGGGSWQDVYSDASNNNPVSAIVLNPANPNQVLIGTSSGNVIRSMDGGITWKLVQNFESRVNMLLWQDGKMFALIKAKGLFAAPENTESFASLTASLAPTTTVFTEYIPSEVQVFHQVSVDAMGSQLMYLATDKGLYKTVDGGGRWIRMVLPVDQELTDVPSVAVAKASSNVVYANVGATIFKSVDGGGRWQTQKVETNGFISYILVDPQLPQIVYGGVYVQE